MSRSHMQTQDLRTRRARAFLRRLERDEAGNVLPLTAGAMVVMLALVGGAVDMSGAYKTERRLQAACDAGVLAGRRAVTTNGFDATALAQANVYFNNNFDPTSQESSATTFLPVSTDNGNIVKATATTKANTMIMKIFGNKTMDLTVTCSASMGVGNSDITFVLDNTGSMADEPDGTSPESGEQSKIQSLRASMKKFRTTVATSVSGSNARVRYAFVPYSSAVNVGKLLPANYLRDSTDIQSRVMVNWSAPTRTWTGTSETEPTYNDYQLYSSTGYTTLTGCNNNKPADTSWAKDGGTYQSDKLESVDPETGELITAQGSQQDWKMTNYECYLYGSKYYILYNTGRKTTTSNNFDARNQIPAAVGATYADIVYQRRTFDTSNYKKFSSVNTPTGTSSGRVANVSSTWEGCIQERQSTPAATFTFASLSAGITPSAATDLDIDTAPTSDPTTQWSVLWPEVSYYRSKDVVYSESGFSAGSYCPYESQLLAEMTQTQFDNYANKMVATGSTYHDIGLIWGARLSSTTGIFSTNVNAKPSNAGSVSRHLIFMTDGELAPTTTVNSSYGIERHDKRVTTDGKTDQYNRHRSRFLAVCEAIKARGIRLWVIAFGTTLDNDLKTCASTKSSYQANNSTELDKQFQEIAKQVGELRITQ